MYKLSEQEIQESFKIVNSYDIIYSINHPSKLKDL
jgi:hypothetical protein